MGTFSYQRYFSCCKRCDSKHATSFNTCNVPGPLALLSKKFHAIKGLFGTGPFVLTEQIRISDSNLSKLFDINMSTTTTSPQTIANAAAVLVGNEVKSVSKSHVDSLTHCNNKPLNVDNTRFKYADTTQDFHAGRVLATTMQMNSGADVQQTIANYCVHGAWGSLAFKKYERTSSPYGRRKMHTIPHMRHCAPDYKEEHPVLWNNFVLGPQLY
jgi:hypothetical protein